MTNFSVNNYTIVPGGSLPITGTWDGTGAEVPNADGSATQTTTTTYTCDATPADPMAASKKPEFDFHCPLSPIPSLLSSLWHCQA